MEKILNFSVYRDIFQFIGLKSTLHTVLHYVDSKQNYVFRGYKLAYLVYSAQLYL